MNNDSQKSSDSKNFLQWAMTPPQSYGLYLGALVLIFVCSFYVGTMTASSLLLTAMSWEVYRRPELGATDRQIRLMHERGIWARPARAEPTRFDGVGPAVHDGADAHGSPTAPAAPRQVELGPA